MRSRTAGVLAALGLTVAIHLDWHLARPNYHDGMSGQWAQHWLLAIPVFALLAVQVSRQPAPARWRQGALVIGAGVLVGQILEPLSELASGATWGWAFGGIRWTAFAEFMAAGLFTFLCAMAWRESGGRGAREPGED